MPTSRSISTAFCHASRFDMPAWMRATSAIWSPTVKTGLSAVIGSWNTIAMRLPRTCCMSPSGSVTRSRPSKRIALPGAVRPGARAEAGGGKGEPGDRGEPPEAPPPPRPVLDDAAPRRSRRAHADTEIRQPGFQEDHVRDPQGGRHEARTGDVREHVPRQDPPR